MVPAPVTAETLRGAIGSLAGRRGEIPEMRARAVALFVDKLCKQEQLGPLFEYLGIKKLQADKSTASGAVDRGAALRAIRS